MHALLAWEGADGALPPELLGLTDKPPGALQEHWWPSVGCGPVGNWWALWWTEPDTEARRGGMVRSRVAVWPEDGVAGVEDLRPTMESLGNVRIPAAPADLLAPLAESLLAARSGPPVVKGLESWPSLLADLWRRLWPAARRRFSARVLINPQQGGEIVLPPWIIGIPAECATRWAEHRLIVPSIRESLSRESRWFIGEQDGRMIEVLGACSSLPGDSSILRRAARAADRLEGLRAAPLPENALSLLRTLIALAPAPNDAAGLKEEAISVLSQKPDRWSAKLVLSLANLDPSSLPNRLLESALRSWARDRAIDIPLQEVPAFLAGLTDARSQSWWRNAASAGLSDALTDLDGGRANLIVRWFDLAETADILGWLLPSTPAVEKWLLNATAGIRHSRTALEFMRVQSLARGWSELHSLAVCEEVSLAEAIQAQLDFPGDPVPGLRFLADRLTASDLALIVTKEVDFRLVPLLAARTVREPELLRDLDASQMGWRAVWIAHIAQGGTPWPPGVDRDRQSRVLLDLVIDGTEEPSLIRPFTAELAAIALRHPLRAKLWPALRGQAPALLLTVAAQITDQILQGQSVSQPEPEVVEAVLAGTRSHSPPLSLILTLLRWNAGIPEATVIQWLGPLHSLEPMSAAHELGSVVLARRWERAAEFLHERRYRSSSFGAAALICSTLVKRWLSRVWPKSPRTEPEWDQKGPPVAASGLQAGLDSKEGARGISGGRLDDAVISQAPPTRVYISFADADDAARESLQRQLAPLQQKRDIEVWSRQLVRPGEDQSKVREGNFEAAEVILLLVSSEYLASEYWNTLEGKRAIQRRETLTIPILLKPCLWKHSELAPLQLLPRDGRALSEQEDRAHALAAIAAAIADQINARRRNEGIT